LKRDFLRLKDLSFDEIFQIIRRAIDLKSGIDALKCPLIGKSIGLIFEKASTRTRVSFEVGIYQLGANSIYMNPNEIQIGRGETIHDTAKVLSRYLDAIIIRTFEHEKIVEFSKYSSIPVINALTDMHHPCQALADLMTIYEKKNGFEGVCIAYIGDGNNVAHSLIEGAALSGMKITIASPEGYEPNREILNEMRAIARNEIVVMRDPIEAVKGADVVYTDVWVSMGQEGYEKIKKERFRGYQLNDSLLSHAKEDAIVLHCMPAHRGEEITDGVIDGPQSVVFEQAENRLHSQKALLEFLLE
jgi:ornithine carbamoyltransferase